MAMQPSDLQLAQRALAGDQSAADDLFRRLWPMVRAAAYSISASHALAEEIAQDSFEILLGRLHEFRGDSQLRTWLTSIVLNRARNVMRQERRSVSQADVQVEDDLDPPEPSIADPAIVAAVRNLDPDRREVIALRYWLDLSPPEIAAVLEVPVGTVHSRLSRAMADLRTELEVTSERP